MVVVSMLSCTDLNPTPLACNSPMVSIRCGDDRPSRSNRHTTNVAPTPQVVEHRRQLRTVGPGTAGGVRPNP